LKDIRVQGYWAAIRFVFRLYIAGLIVAFVPPAVNGQS
jgi:hypothetical protein